MSLIVHCGARLVTQEEVEAVPMPPQTATYCPVPHIEVVNRAHQSIMDNYGVGETDIEWQFALGRKNHEGIPQHFFALAIVTAIFMEGMRLSLGFRNSINKSLQLEGAGGANVMVCDNLEFHGSDIHVMRKHTPNIMRDLDKLIETTVVGGLKAFDRQLKALKARREILVPYEKGLEVIGRAQDPANPILRAQEATVALREWHNPTFEVQGGTNLDALHQCFTHALKRSQPGHTVANHAKASDFLRSLFGLPEDLN